MFNVLFGREETNRGSGREKMEEKEVRSEWK